VSSLPAGSKKRHSFHYDSCPNGGDAASLGFGADDCDCACDCSAADADAGRDELWRTRKSGVEDTREPERMRSMCTLRSGGAADTDDKPDTGDAERLLLLLLLRPVPMLPFLFRDDEAERVRLTPLDLRECWRGFWRMELRMLVGICRVEFLPLFLPSNGSLSK